MPNIRTKLLLALLFFETHFFLCKSVDVLHSNSLTNNEVNLMVRRACTGKIGECFSATELELELEMDSETNRRMLVMQKKYISYETLKKDIVPCSKAGAPYYNCHSMGQANPYTRGCEVITGCARDIRDPGFP